MRPGTATAPTVTVARTEGEVWGAEAFEIATALRRLPLLLARTAQGEAEAAAEAARLVEAASATADNLVRDLAFAGLVSPDRGPTSGVPPVMTMRRPAAPGSGRE